MRLTAVAPVRFRLDALPEESRLPQRVVADRSAVSQTTSDRMSRDPAEQVALETPDSWPAARSEALGHFVEPGELMGRGAPERGGAK